MTEVTVVVPTHDRSTLLGLTLRSALRQRDVDLEVIVVDDGSADTTAETVTGFGDPRLRLVRHPLTLGVSAARNTGVAHSTGEWIALLDDDDLWAPDKLALQLAAARSAGRAWAYAGYVDVGDDLRVLGGSPPQPPERVMAALRRHNAIPAGASNVVVRADALADAGPFDTRLRNNEDWDMWLRLARGGPPACVSRPLLAYRVHAGNASRNMPRMIAELDAIARRHGVPVDRAAHHRWAAWTYLGEGNRRQALHHYGQAIRAGDVLSVARAAVTVAGQGITTARRRARDGRAAQDSWVVQAQEWIDALAVP